MQMAQFLCLKNIRTFLATCTSAFDLKESDLFQASMLYDYTDFARVLHTLSRLSNCSVAKAAKPGAQGFPGSLAQHVVNVKHRTIPNPPLTGASNEPSNLFDNTANPAQQEVSSKFIFLVCPMRTRITALSLLYNLQILCLALA